MRAEKVYGKDNKKNCNLEFVLSENKNNNEKRTGLSGQERRNISAR